MAKLILLARYSPRPKPKQPTEEAGESAADFRDRLRQYEEDVRLNSCDRQLAEMRDWAASKGHTILAEYREDALSGDTSEDRPVLTAALEACKKGCWLVVRDFQRLSRNSAFLLAALRDLTSRGVVVYSLTEGRHQEEDDEAWLSSGVRALFGEYYRRKVRKRTKARMIEHQKNGRRMSNIAPYGYRRNDENGRRLVPDEHEQAVIARILALRRDDPSISLRGIAGILTAEGMAPRSSVWRSTTIMRIIARHTATTEKQAH